MRDNRDERRPVNGVHRDNARASAIPLDGHDAYEPVDLVAVQADDELINALAAGYPVASAATGQAGFAADDHVAAILAAWKAEVDERPIPELVDLDQAVAAVLAGRPRPARARHLAPLAAAAAFLVLTLGGVSVTSHSAEPGDVLWPVSRVLFSERADSVEAAVRVEEHIDLAKRALVSGQPTMAEQELVQAEAELVAVRPEEGQVELADVQDFLLVKAQETPEGIVADLDAPLATQPERRVPPGVATTPDVPPLPSSVRTRPSTTGPSSGPVSSVSPVVPSDTSVLTDVGPGPEPTPPSPVRPTTPPTPLPDVGQPSSPTTEPTGTSVEPTLSTSTNEGLAPGTSGGGATPSPTS